MTENTVSLIGSHNTKNGAGADWPARVVFLNGGYGMGEEHKDTMMIFRKAGVPERPPDLYTHPGAKTLEFARYYYSDPGNVVQEPFKPTWDGLPPGYIKTFTNEACGTDRHEMETYIAYEKNMCELAYADGHILGIGKFASGTPRWDSGLWQELYAPWLVEAWNKYQAIYVRHIYGYPNSDLNDPGDLVDENGNLNTNIPTSAQRIIDELDCLKALGWGGGVAFTECGLQGGYGVTDWNRFYFQITKFEQALRPYADHVIGFCWWECGHTDDWEADYTEYLKQMTPYMTENALPKWEPPEPTEPTPEPPTEGTTEEKIFNYSQSWAFPVNEDAALQAQGLADGFTPSGVEEWRVVDGVKYAMQPFYKIGDTNTKRSYYAVVGNWGNVKSTDGSTTNEVVLDIPHMSQNGPGADARRNDCGAACAAMVINGETVYAPTVDEIAIEYQQNANLYMNFGEIGMALDDFGIDGNHTRPIYAKDIAEEIENGRPVIALVWYQALPYQFSTFNGSHFIVIYGAKDGELLYHDPLSLESKVLWCSFEQMNEALAQVVHEGNMAYQAMVCVKREVVEPPPTGKTVDMLPYFTPTSTHGLQVVFRFSDGKTQPQQMEAIGEQTVLWKGEGQTIDGKRVYDYEQIIANGAGIQKGTDTSSGGATAYNLSWVEWLPRYATAGTVYKSQPVVKTFNRVTCEMTGQSTTTDYIYFKELLDVWTSPYDETIKFFDVPVFEWRKTPDINTPPIEVYKFAKNVMYCEWNNGAVAEVPEGREPLSFELTDCIA